MFQTEKVYDVTPKECCDILGVSAGATQDEIKKAFKKKAMTAHPDKGGKQEDFVRLNEAYSILSGKQKSQSHEQPFSGVDLGDLFGGAGIFDFNPFNNMFSRGEAQYSQPQYPEHDKDVQINFSITAEDVRKGRTMKVNFQKGKKCDSCNGIGGKERMKCPTCNGKGQIRQERKQGNMVFVNTSHCSTCHGHGSQLIDPCKKCEGSGIIIYQDQIIVEIKEKK